MSIGALIDRWGHEDVQIHRDQKAGLTVVVAIHDTTLGPACGGTRMKPYPSLDLACVDALRLSRAMTFKAANSRYRPGETADDWTMADLTRR